MQMQNAKYKNIPSLLDIQQNTLTFLNITKIPQLITTLVLHEGILVNAQNVLGTLMFRHFLIIKYTSGKRRGSPKF